MSFLERLLQIKTSLKRNFIYVTVQHFIFTSYLPLLLVVFLSASCANWNRKGNKTPAATSSTKEITVDPKDMKPKLVKPGSDGVIRLTAIKARAIGPEIKYMPEWKAFGFFTSEDRVEWDVKVKDAGEYEVHLEWSVSDQEAGKPFMFKAADKELVANVNKTGSWLTYKTEKVGRIQLSAKRQVMEFKPNSSFRKGGALLDLREIKLVPVKS